MPIPNGDFSSNYTRGEAVSLAAPLFNCQPEDLSDIIIIAMDHNDAHVGVYSTFACKISNIHWRTRVIGMLSDAINMMAEALYTESPQHGPGEH